MGTSKAQRARVEVVCKCGCGETFMAFPVYRPKSEGGGLRTPDYKRAHHPNCRKGLSGSAWNKGLTKDDHPSISKMGFQPGHEPYNDWSHVNEKLANDPDFRARWLEAKKGQVAWNAGLDKSQYPNGMASGPDHGNWAGGLGGFRDTSEWNDLRNEIKRRDNYTCQACGDCNYKGRGSRIKLEVHHIVSVREDPSRIWDRSNLTTLCPPCHRQTHNYGIKAVRLMQGRSGN